MRTDKPIRYVKVWTSYLNDAALYRLPLAHRAVYFLLHLLSGLTSDAPGWFVVNDEPMTLREITTALHCTTAADERAVPDAIRRLMAARLLQQHPTMGWSITRWEHEQASYNRETPEESAARVRRWRKKKRDESARAQLHLVRDGGGK